jgi:hypothetical protein
MILFDNISAWFQGTISIPDGRREGEAESLEYSPNGEFETV